MKPDIIFIPISDNAAKLAAVCTLANSLFRAEKKLLIHVPSSAAAVYLDNLLWGSPEESFLPHAIVSTPSNEWCAISVQSTNWNQAKCLLNLCPEASPFSKEFETVYELWDETDPAKTALSAERKAFYEALC